MENLYDWNIITEGNFEYVEGYREFSERLFETSYIKYKIPMKEYLLVVTSNESLYKLYYVDSYDKYLC